MIELRTLGTIDLIHTGDGRRIQSLLAQPKRSALLVYLALASRGGSHRRDSLVSRFWPESDDPRARHALRQSLYAIRRSLDNGVVRTTGNQDVSVDPAHLWSDVVAFEEAVAANALEKAVDLYRGPFLDGFYVSDSPEFERWAEAERERLARTYASVLERLAEERMAAGEVAAAVDWYRRLVDHDPFSTPAVLRLMRTLDAAGERTEAIRQASAYTSRLGAELGLDPNSEVEALAERLRSEPAAQVRAPESAAPSATGGLAGFSSGSELVWRTESASTTSIATPTDSRAWTARHRHRLRVAAVLMIVFAGMTAVWRLWNLYGPPPSRVSVVVVPLDRGGAASAGGSEPGVNFRGHIETALELLPEIQVLDGRGISPDAGAWRALPLRERIALAHRLDADYVVVGELLGGGSEGVAVQAYETETRSRIYHGLGSESGESVSTSIQGIGLELLRTIAARQRIDLGDLGYLLSATNSPAAVAHLREGQDQFRRRDMDAAVASFRQAIAADSLCGLAYHRLSVAETWNPRWDFPAALAAVDVGLARHDRIAPRWVQLLEAQRRYVLHDAVGAQLAFQRIAAENPEIIDAWLGLGESIYHLHGYQGGDPSSATAVFERLIALDSSFAAVYHHVVELAVISGDRARAERYLPHLLDRYRATNEAAIALRFGDASERAETLRSLRSAERITISNLVRLFRHEPTLVDSLGRILQGSERTPDDRLRGAQYRFIALASQGRWPEAVAAWRPQGGASNFDPWVIHAYLAGHPADTVAAPMFEWARSVVEEGWTLRRSWPISERRDPFRALVHRALLEGDSAEVTTLLLRLDAVSELADPSDPEPAGLRASLLARLELLSGDMAQATRLLESAVQRIPWDPPFSSFDPMGDAAPQRLLLAQLWLAQGNSGRAEQWLDSFENSWAVGDALYSQAVAATRAQLPNSRAARRDASAAPGG